MMYYNSSYKPVFSLHPRPRENYFVYYTYNIYITINTYLPVIF